MKVLKTIVKVIAFIIGSLILGFIGGWLVTFAICLGFEILGVTVSETAGEILRWILTLLIGAEILVNMLGLGEKKPPKS